MQIQLGAAVCLCNPILPYPKGHWCFVCIYLCIYVSMYLCIYVSMYLSIICHLSVCTHIHIQISLNNAKDWFVGSKTLCKCSFTVCVLHVAFFGTMFYFLIFIYVNMFLCMYINLFSPVEHCMNSHSLFSVWGLSLLKFFIIRNTATVKVLVVICVYLSQRYSRAVLFNTVATIHMWVFKFLN